MSKKLQFPIFARAVESASQASRLKDEIGRLELQEKELKLNTALPPLEAARDFVERETRIKAELREHRLAFTLADPNIVSLWREAVVEMRPEAARIEADLSALRDRAAQAATSLLAPVAQNSAAVVGHTTVVAEAQHLVSEFQETLFSALNSASDSIAVYVTALHSVIEQVPERVKAVNALINRFEQAASHLEHSFAQPSSDTGKSLGAAI